MAEQQKIKGKREIYTDRVINWIERERKKEC